MIGSPKFHTLHFYVMSYVYVNLTSATYYNANALGTVAVSVFCPDHTFRSETLSVFTLLKLRSHCPDFQSPTGFAKSPTNADTNRSSFT